MKLFNARIAQTDEELCIAALSADHASEVFVCFWVSRTGGLPGDFMIGRGAPLDYLGHDAVGTIEAGNVAGVVVRQTDGTMLFEPEIAA